MSAMLSMQWKEEPLSPVGSDEVTWLSEDTLYCSPKQDDVKLDEYDDEACQLKAEVASQILENLENLIDLDELIKEEPFYLDTKMLPLLDEMNHPPVPVKVEHFKQPHTEVLLSEFNVLVDVVGYEPNTLTPPQSPPSETRMFTTLEPISSQTSYINIPEIREVPLYVPEKQLLEDFGNFQYRTPNEYPTSITPQPDIAHELAVVDELVRSRVEHMQWNNSPPSPCSNSSSGNSSSGSSNFGDCSSDDPEWMPEIVGDSPKAATSTPKTRKRSKPYSSSYTDKKSRKKEQNKNAATRYRLKKKAEVEEILTEEKQLQNESVQHKEKINDLEREIKYLKGLMRDLFKAKGLID